MNPDDPLPNPISLSSKLDIAKNWLPRYTGMSIDQFGDYVLLTNFSNYVTSFAERFGCVSMTLEMPFKDHEPMPCPAQEWSSRLRCRYTPAQAFQ